MINHNILFIIKWSVHNFVFHFDVHIENHSSLHLPRPHHSTSIDSLYVSYHHFYRTPFHTSYPNRYTEAETTQHDTPSSPLL